MQPASSYTVVAMSERYEDPHQSAGRAMSTGEFRATPDASASTAQFRAFAHSEAEPGRPWDVGAPGRSVAKMTAIVVAVAVAIAVIAILIVTLG
jgi:hypothetical protein